jgi:hypothetical protein
MALPGNLSTITLTGTYIDFTGGAIAGQVQITLSDVLINSAADRIIIPSTITAVLDVNGSFSLTVPVTDDPDINPAAFSYTFDEAFLGGSSYTITLLSSLGASVDITDLRATQFFAPFAQPVSGDLFQLLKNRVTQEEEDLDDDPLLLGAPTYENLSLFLDTYDDIDTEFALYSALDGTPLNPELNFSEARIQELIDRINDLYNFTASSLELRDTLTGGTVTNATYAGLTAKRGTYAGLAANTSPSTYVTTANALTWTYAEVGTLITQLGFALSGTGTLTDPYLSITRTSTDGSYGAFGLQGLTYATLASTYPTYASPTGAVFTFTYRDTADTIRDEANRINRLMLIGAKP